MYDDYFASFQRLDVAATAGYFAVPAFRAVMGRIAILASEQDVRDLLHGLCARLRECGYQESRIAALDVTVLDATIAHVRARGTRHDGGGAAFERFDVVYTLVRPGTGSEWRITGLTSIEPSG